MDLLKVAHHGSRTASSQALLEALRPAVADVTAGTGNPYGHPAPALLHALENRGFAVYRTDLDGDIALVPEPDGRLAIHTRP